MNRVLTAVAGALTSALALALVLTLGLSLAAEDASAGVFTQGTFSSAAGLNLPAPAAIYQAVNVGPPSSSAGSNSPTVGGVTFAADTTGIFAPIPADPAALGGDWPTPNFGNASLNTLLSSFYYNAYGPWGDMQYTITGLTTGVNYRVQLIMYDGDNNNSLGGPLYRGITTITAGTDTLNFNYAATHFAGTGNNWSNSEGVYVNYDFTANNTGNLNVSFHNPEGTNIILNAFDVQVVPEPASLGLVMFAGVGMLARKRMRLVK